MNKIIPRKTFFDVRKKHDINRCRNEIIRCDIEKLELERKKKA